MRVRIGAGCALIGATLTGPTAAPSQRGGAFAEDPSMTCRNERPFRVTPRDMDWIPVGVTSIAILGRLKMVPVSGGFRYEVMDELYSVKIVPSLSIAEGFDVSVREMLSGRIEVVGCLDAAWDDGTIPVFGVTHIPDAEKDAEPREASIERLLQSPDTFDGARVRVDGRFGGGSHRSLSPHTRAATTDWVLEDGESAIWVGGADPAGEGFRLDPDDGADRGKGLSVVGRVSYWQGKPRVRADRVLLLPGAEEAERPIVLFTEPTGGSAVASGAQVEVRFSEEMAASTASAKVRLAYEDDPKSELPLPSVGYDPEWWSLLVTLPSGLEPERWIELRLGEDIRDAEGRSLDPVTYRFRVAPGGAPTEEP